MKNKVKMFLIVALALTMILSLTACDSLFGGGSKDVESVTISGSDTVAVNVETTYTATVSPSDATHSGITWAISGENTVGATISNDGLFKATSAGMVKISATAGGKTGEKTITVQFIEATSINVSNISGVVGSPLTLVATLTPNNASNTNITYELVNNTIGATLTGNQVTSDNLGTISYKAKVGNLESNTATITFTLDPANGETITTAEQFNSIRNNLSGKYQLGADIDLSGYSNWTPIGTSSVPFTGTLSGNGYTIQNLTISSLSTDGSGLFGQMNGTVQNLKIVASINAGNAGGIAGVSNGTITGCEVSGTIGRSNSDYIGGIVARQTGGNINNNKNNAVIVGANFVGGIVGHLNLGSANRTFENCENNGTVTGVGQVGGIAGRLEGTVASNYNTYNSTVRNLKNNSVIIGTADSVGGIVGLAQGTNQATSRVHNITFALCENNANVTGGSMVGGIVGNAAVRITSIQTSENNGNITGLDYIGGILGRGDVTALSGYTNSSTITGRAYVGGIAGRAGVISASENNGTVVATGTIVEGGVSRAYLGGLAGYCTSLSNSKNTTAISYNNGGENVGGLAGFVGGSVSSCTNDANVTSNGSNVGGIAGHIDFINASRVLENSTNNGTVTGVNNVGGIAGIIAGTVSANYNTYNSSISGCTNNSAITGTGDNVGGIAGRINRTNQSTSRVHNIAMASCENRGNISGKNYVGGYLGRGDNIPLTSLINENTITGGAYVGGIAGRGGAFQNCENRGAINASGTVSESGSTNAYVGGIAGFAVSIGSCVNEINITYTQNANFVAGIAGYVEGGNVANSQNSGAIVSSGNNVGGIVGYYNAGNRGGRIENCTNNGTVNGVAFVGGIAGAVLGAVTANYNTFDTAITGCTNNSAVTGTGESVGGIVGHATGTQAATSRVHRITFSSCVNNANVTGGNNAQTGGILGRAGANIQPQSNCTNTGTINNGNGHQLLP